MLTNGIDDDGSEIERLLEDVKSFISRYKGYFTVMSVVSNKRSLPDLESFRINNKMTNENKTDSRAERLMHLNESDVNGCVKCELNKTRKNIVFGEGDPESRLMFIGEAPGAEEDNTGRPFVGRAGRLLTKIIESIDMKREDVYIANIIKCRPPENRNPLRDEIVACAPFLREQITIIKPKIICTLGKFSTEFIIGTDKGTISAVRGKEFDYNGITVIPTYHPSYLLRNQSAKRQTWEDMKKIRNLCSKI